MPTTTSFSFKLAVPGVGQVSENSINPIVKNKVEGYDFRNFEAALVRLGLKLRREKTYLKPE